MTQTFHYNRIANGFSKKAMQIIGKTYGVEVSFNKSAFVGAFEINATGTQQALEEYFVTTKLRGNYEN
jgi:hypothetical protein